MGTFSHIKILVAQTTAMVDFGVSWVLLTRGSGGYTSTYPGGYYLRSYCNCVRYFRSGICGNKSDVRQSICSWLIIFGPLNIGFILYTCIFWNVEGMAYKNS